MRITPSRVLMADDEPRNLALLEAILEPLAVEIRTAVNGREAVDFFEQARGEIDLILLDVMMPELDGFRALAEIRSKCPANDRVPIVLVTAMVARESRVRAAEAGADDLLIKPLDPHEVRSRVRAFLALRRAQKDLARLQATRSELLRDIGGPLSALRHNLEGAAAELACAGSAAALERVRRAATAADNVSRVVEAFAGPREAAFID